MTLWNQIKLVIAKNWNVPQWYCNVSSTNYQLTLKSYSQPFTQQMDTYAPIPCIEIYLINYHLDSG